VGTLGVVVDPPAFDDDPRLGEAVEDLAVQQLRSARRVGPDMHVSFDTVAEVVPTRVPSVGGVTLPVLGGSTIMIAPSGEVRYVIRKRVDHEERSRQHSEYVNSSGLRFWESDGAAVAPRADGLCLMCTSG